MSRRPYDLRDPITAAGLALETLRLLGAVCSTVGATLALWAWLGA
ncbi:hypothetical protein NPA31_011830 [Aurantimonas sp. MSK8Z-1]|nr:hypothetical protein [Aurantimonas sp. MSK8Z-1]MCW4115653.1 hypothetical protein [Aurantimonas sp. MSK8Z-1]